MINSHLLYQLSYRGMRRMLLIEKDKSSFAQHFGGLIRMTGRTLRLPGQFQPGPRGGWQVGAGAPGQGDVPVGVGFVQGDQGDASVLVLVGQHARQEGDAESGGHQVDDEVDLPAAGGYLRHDAFALARFEDLGVQGKAGFEQDKG
jgi:hypothetical protein